MSVAVMMAKELLDELIAFRNEDSDAFDDMEIQVDIFDRASYDEEHGPEKEEYTETLIGSGLIYAVVVPTDYDLSGEEPKPTRTYLCLRAVEYAPDEGTMTEARL